MQMRVLCGFAVATLLVVGPRAAGAQRCDDFNQCTANDMCREGECTGTLQSGGSCDDGNECTVNDQCGPDGTCLGTTNAPVGTPCGGGCGTCQSLFPIPGVPLQCLGDVANNGNSCDASFVGPCVQGACQIIGTVPGFPAIAFCFPRPVECPSTGNCKGACNPQTGQCDNNISLCFPDCERCDQGECVPANQDKACQGVDPCSSQSKCGVLGGRGFCVPGAPSGDLPTPTPTGQVPTPTVPPSGGCVGDCDGDGEVQVNELIVGMDMVLGSAQLTQCSSFDHNDDGEVAINELILGVNAALDSCDG